MKKQIGMVAALPLILALAHAASASTVLYDNGPINGTVGAWNISSAIQVSNSFNLGGASTVTGANFGAWTRIGQTISSVDWSISSGALDTGTVFGSGTAAVSSTLFSSGVQGIYDVNAASLSLPALNLSGGSYFFSLTDAVNTGGNFNTFWDDNSGPSTAFRSVDGQLPGSESFQILGSPVPEPSQAASLALGLAALGGLMLFARKRQNAAA